MTDGPHIAIPVGTVFKDKWVILELIARGAMGEVYRAHQLNLRRDIAVKVVSPEWIQCLDDDQEEIDTTFQRFRREMEAMAKIRHPNVLQIFDFDEVSFKKGERDVSVEYIAMEYIQGETLRATMSEDGFSPDEDAVRAWLVNYFFPVLDGVQAMHEAGIIHRDIKPENVLLDGHVPKIADFGLARSCRLKSVTRSIDIKGTPPYMSPEHFSDFRRADEKADIYSLGKILFEAIDGKMTPKTVPFKSAALKDPGTPFFAALDRIIRKTTAENKKERIGSVAELRNGLLEALATLEKAPPQVAKPSTMFANPKWIWTGIAVAVLSMGLMTIWHLLGEPSKAILLWKEPQKTGQGGDTPSSFLSQNKSLSTSNKSEATLQGQDGVILHFVRGGTISVPEHFGPYSKNQVDLEPFYMDETQVTNQQYVKFLNQVLPKVSVDNGVVRGGTDIWLLLDEVMEGYEPIIFRKGRFFIKDITASAHPVVRVTAYGAAAYARFNGKRLPTELEWLQAAMGKGTWSRTGSTERPEFQGSNPNENGRDDDSDQSDRGAEYCSRIPSPVSEFKSNEYGIRGLNCNVSEWGVRFHKEYFDETGEPQYVVLGGVGSILGGGGSLLGADVILPSPIPRQPWEAFEEVGFRCVQSAQKP